MKQAEVKQVRRRRRRLSVRRGLKSSHQDYRLSVFRSSKHIYAQLIEVASGRTVSGIGTATKSVAAATEGKCKVDRAAHVGAEIARIAKEKGIESVVFDRGHSKFHGRVKALAEAAREGGLKF